MVPQVTFSCTLDHAYVILFDLIKNTPRNSHIEELYKINDMLKSQYTDDISYNGFIFMLHYYHYILKKNHSKQHLAFALRHKYIEIYRSLGSEYQRHIDKNFGEIMRETDDYESKDDVTRYIYNNDGKILIEYRLLGYVMSGKPDDNSIKF